MNKVLKTVTCTSVLSLFQIEVDPSGACYQP